MPNDDCCALIGPRFRPFLSDHTALPSSLARSAARFTVVLAGCSTSSNDADLPLSPAALGAAAALGERIFHDPTLSASGRQSCASCHDPASAFAAGGGSVPLGGPALDVPGFRNGPSLKYLGLTPAFFFDSAGTPIALLNTLTDGFEP